MENSDQYRVRYVVPPTTLPAHLIDIEDTHTVIVVKAEELYAPGRRVPFTTIVTYALEAKNG